MQKWSKGKVRDKLNNQVLFDKATYEKLLKEVPIWKLITPSVVSERLKVRGSLARKALDELLQKGNFAVRASVNLGIMIRVNILVMNCHGQQWIDICCIVLKLR